MSPDKHAMTNQFTIPKHWQRWAFANGYSVEKIAVMAEEFKRFYAKTNLELTDIAWERRFHRWVQQQRGPVYHPTPVVHHQPPEPEKPRNPFIGFQYLAQMKMMLSGASNKLEHN